VLSWSCLLDEDGRRGLLVLQKCGGGEDRGVGGIVPFLHGGDDHGVEFLPKLDDLSSLAVVIGGHRRWWCGTPRGGAAHRRYHGRREDGRPLGFERSGSKKNLSFNYHIGERHVVEYWMPCIDSISIYL
jgi:hypothetical protein